MNTYKQMKHTIKKSELRQLIQESITAAMEGFDQGDLALHQSANGDQELKMADKHIDDLKALTMMLTKKQSPASIGILKNINASLGPFVQKVTNAVKAGKLQ